jgi:CheY-like chemotaxis protein
MRPPIKILLIDSNEEQRSVRAFALAVNGYRVTQAEAAYPEAIHKRNLFDLRIGVWPVGAFTAPCTPSLLIYGKGTGEDALDLAKADAYMCDPSMRDLLERVKILTAKKRGPQPKRDLTAVKGECLHEGCFRQRIA